LALYAKVDAFFERTRARYPGETGLGCRRGCADCCLRFSVTPVEAELIQDSLPSLVRARRAALRQRAERDAEPSCPALEPARDCAIYASRPLICRTHGLAIRFVAEQPSASALLDCCPKSFLGHDLSALEPQAVLDQSTLSTLLGAIQALRSAELGRPWQGERVEMAWLMAQS